MSDVEDFAWFWAEVIVGLILVPFVLLRMAWEFGKYTWKRR